MKKVYRLTHVDCAHCAGLMEKEVSKIPGVQHASLAFMTQRLTVEAENPDALRDEIDAAVKKIDRRCSVAKNAS